MEKKMPRIAMSLAGAALVGGICLGGAQTAVAAPAAEAAGADPQPQPQQATDPSTSTSTTVEQVNDKTTKTTTVTTDTNVTTGSKGATTTTTTETTDTETRTAYDQQRVQDPTLPEGTEAVKQQGIDEVSTDRTVKTTTTTEQPFQENVYKLLDGRNEAGKDKFDRNIYRKMTGTTHMPQFGETCINKITVTEAYRFALVNVDNPKDVRYSDWNFIHHFSMTIDDNTGTHVLSDEEIRQKDKRFWSEKQQKDGHWKYDADELLAKLKANALGFDGTTIKVLEGEEPTADQVAAILGLNGADGNGRTNSAARSAAMRGMVGASADDGNAWRFSADGKSIVRTVVTVETMPTVTVPGQDEIVAYNPAAPATPATPEGPAGPAGSAQPAGTPAAAQVAAPVAQTAAPAQAATSAAATPQTSDSLGAYAGVVAVLPAALGLLAMALLKRRRA